MNFKLRNLVAATLAGSFLMGFGVNAMADSTTDIVNALVAKGVLTEEEGALLTKGRTDEAAGQAKALKKAGRVTVSDAIDNATFYGDVRVRGEHRSGDGVGATTATPVSYSTTAGATTTTAAVAAVAVPGVSVNRDRARYKLTFGVKTTSGAFDTDLAFAMGAAGRSDNATFGASASSSAPFNNKDALYVKRAKVGFKATDWLTVDAGRFDNPLYITPMVWDADLTVEGLAEKFKYTVGSADLFFTALQSSYKGDRNLSSISGTTVIESPTVELFAYQGGARFGINDNTSVKAALTYTDYNHNTSTTPFKPGLTGTMASGNFGVNDLNTIDVPAEINFMTSSNVGVRLYGDYVVNTSGSDRFNAAVAASGTSATALKAAGNDDTAWMLGLAVGSAKDLKAFEGNKMAKGDWSAKIWYQDVGTYAVDQNAVDSDIFDSRVNMKGTTFKAQYNIQDNVYMNFAYGHAKIKNAGIAAAYSGGNDLALNLTKFDLVQLDLTYKF